VSALRQEITLFGEIAAKALPGTSSVWAWRRVSAISCIVENVFRNGRDWTCAPVRRWCLRLRR
jgi:hypothetical protein